MGCPQFELEGGGVAAPTVCRLRESGRLMSPTALAAALGAVIGIVALVTLGAGKQRQLATGIALSRNRFWRLA
jgi:hypothetical protein